MKSTLIFIALLFAVNAIQSTTLKKLKHKASQNGDLYVDVDDLLNTVTINGETITLTDGNESNWAVASHYSVPLTAGDTVEIFGTNGGGPAGIIATISYVDGAGNSQEVSTNTADWTCGGVTPTKRGTNGDSPWGAIASISSSAQWIWNSASNIAQDKTSCKIVLPGVVPTVAVSNDWSAVLTWGSAVRDMDLYSILPNGKKVYFRNKQSGNVTLDVDDRDGAGPETLNFNSVVSGTYQIWVHDYSREVAITQSEAQVVVYRGDTQVEAFTVPTSGAGGELWWHVCDLNADSGSLETANTVSTLLRA